jgi:hypothetical protein
MFFVIASHIPSLCLLASILSVLVFSASVAFEVRPTLVIVSGVVGLLMAGDILVFYIHRLMVRVWYGVCIAFKFVLQWRQAW